jgi:hypothetical protein
MAKRKPKTTELPLGGARGVAALSIPEIDKAVDAYERKKEKRCNASPGEIAAKRDLRDLIVKHRDELPTDEDGHRYYRKDGVDYRIEETLKRQAADDGEVRGESL